MYKDLLSKIENAEKKASTFYSRSKAAKKVLKAIYLKLNWPEMNRKNVTHTLAWTMVLQEMYLCTWAWFVPLTMAQPTVPPTVMVQKVWRLSGFMSKLVESKVHCD